MTIAMIGVGLAFAAMGVVALVRPNIIPTQFGTDAETPDSRTEIRAVYGGFGVAMAVLLFVAAPQSGDLRVGVALAVGIALAGMALGRLIGILVEWPPSLYPTVTFLLVELTAAAVLLVPAAAR